MDSVLKLLIFYIPYFLVCEPSWERAWKWQLLSPDKAELGAKLVWKNLRLLLVWEGPTESVSGQVLARVEQGTNDDILYSTTDQEKTFQRPSISLHIDNHFFLWVCPAFLIATFFSYMHSTGEEWTRTSRMEIKLVSTQPLIIAINIGAIWFIRLFNI